jgi:hypothetical protein
VKSGLLIVCGQSKGVDATADVAAGYRFNTSKKVPESHILLKLGTVMAAAAVFQMDLQYV